MAKVLELKLQHQWILTPSNEYSGLIVFRIDWFDLLAVQGTLKSLLQHHSSEASILQCPAFFTAQLLHGYKKHSLTICTFISSDVSAFQYAVKVYLVLRYPSGAYILPSLRKPEQLQRKIHSPLVSFFLALPGLCRGVRSSHVEVCGLLWLQCSDSAVVAFNLSCPTACGPLVPWPGSEPTSPALEGGLLITGPPGKSLGPSHFTSSKRGGTRLRRPGSSLLLPWVLFLWGLCFSQSASYHLASQKVLKLFRFPKIA